MEATDDSPLRPRTRLVGFLATDANNTQKVLAACEPILPDEIGLSVGILLTPAHVQNKHVRAPWKAFMPDAEQARAIRSLKAIKAFTTKYVAPLTLHARSETEGTEPLFEELSTMFAYLGQEPDLLHLDNDRRLPSTDLIGLLKAQHPKLRLIIHLGTTVQASHQDDPEACVSALVTRYGAHLATHGGTITHVLWDGCGRRFGSELDPQRALRFVQALHRQAPHVEPIVSGRLGPETLSVLDPIWAETREFSLDAHRQLAPRFGEPVDPERTIRYIQGVLRRLAAS